MDALRDVVYGKASRDPSVRTSAISAFTRPKFPRHMRENVSLPNWNSQ